MFWKYMWISCFIISLVKLKREFTIPLDIVVWVNVAAGEDGKL